MLIRPEEPRDFDAIDDVVRRAFGSDIEVLLVHNIRDGDGYVPEFALVAEDQNQIVGHIMLSYVRLGSNKILQLSPLAVRPDHQRQGIGDALSREALELAEAKGEPLVCVLGIPAYYPRFGFESARALGIDPPDPNIPDGPWMIKRLTNYDPALRGLVDFGPPFDLPPHPAESS